MLICSVNSGFPFSIFFVFSILLSFFPGNVQASSVTLNSIQIYKTHEWIGKPTVYFRCHGENKTILPDVKKADVEYTFKGEESWQPLTNFSSKKCKRCGFYEKDTFPWSHSEVFDEWEFCPADFSSDNASYTLVKEKEFNATFSCSECADLDEDPNAATPNSRRKGLSVGIIILISSIATIVALVGFIGGYKWWKKRKRQQEQLRFMKLFEEQDDLEDELGLDDDI